MIEECIVQKIHVETQVKVGVGNVAAVLNIFDVPYLAIKSMSDFAEVLCEFSKLTGVVRGFAIGDAGYKYKAIFRKLGDGSK